MKKITVILSGVGTSGYSCIALMEFFDRHQIKPSLIVGCSSGALVAALWARGVGPKVSHEIIRKVYLESLHPKIDLFTSLFFFRSPTKNYPKDRALLDAKNMKRLYRDIFVDYRIEHLPVQTMFQSTDLDLGQTHFIKRGKIADAVYAASAILPFYPPIKMNNRWLVDGVFTESLPLGAVLAEDSEVIIATDVRIEREKQTNNFMSFYDNFLEKSLRISSAASTALLYDMHDDEILIIPIKVTHHEDKDPIKSLNHSIEIARESIAQKESLILQTIR